MAEVSLIYFQEQMALLESRLMESVNRRVDERVSEATAELKAAGSAGLPLPEEWSVKIAEDVNAKMLLFAQEGLPGEVDKLKASFEELQKNLDMKSVLKK